MARTLTSKEKLLVTVMAFLAAGGGLYQFVLNPLMKQRSALESSVQGLQQQTAQIRAQLRDLKQLEQQYQEVQTELQHFQELIPDQKEIPGLLKQIELMGLQCNVDVPNISTTQPIDRGKYRAMNINLSIDGRFLDDLQFFHRLASAPRLITVQNVGFSSYDEVKGTMQVSIKASIYMRGGAGGGPTK